MAVPHHDLAETSGSGTAPCQATSIPSRAPSGILSEFEAAQIRKVAQAGAALAADVVQWHRDIQADAAKSLELQLSHGMGLAVIGAVVMQILAWTRLLEPWSVPPSTLRAAREIMEGATPEADLARLDYRAQALLQRAFAIKAQARRVSRLW
ncbi:hypothetical protein CCC_03091 [Paramagnetospirillum magnetotacticum MS-1]|uniref:Uncharacterized protein n=1 Tax=Paramagnetospirillum magnetotacticum MS-1 TaxID=272627 RepID=A0A0C2UFK5_PARME|nr:hypothetical protein [Paramagnetospirillum magnetotacticum]KIM00303.1 hypothetical protein CCC_03091 [Paramagnetospirillum magnetotacticum MS-1]